MNEDTWPARRSDRADNSGNSSAEMTYVEDIISKWLWRTVAPGLLLTGLVGNFYVIRILSRVKFRKCIKLHLSLLAFVDMIILLTGLSRLWINYTFGIDIRTFSSFGCQVHVYIQFTSVFFSAWILVSYALERYIAMEFPIQVNSWCPIGRTRLRLILVFLFLSLMNVHVFWVFGLVRYKRTTICRPTLPHLQQFRSHVFVWIYACFMCFLPFLVLTALNSLLIRNLSRNCRLQQHLWTRMLQRSKDIPIKKAVVREDSVRFKLLFTTSFFLITTSPSAVHTLVSSSVWTESDGHLQACLYLSWTLTSLLQYMNYTFNVFLYTWRTVRREETLRKTRLYKSSSTSHRSRTSSTSSDFDTKGHVGMRL